MNRILLKNQKKSFKKENFRRKILAMLLFFSLLSVSKTNAQITITVQNNTNTTPNLATSYPSLLDALTALNAVTAMTGTVYMTAFTYGTETAPPKGFTIGSATLNPVLSATNNVMINGNGSLINAGIGIGNPTSPSPDGMVKLVGANYIDFRNFLLVDGNTTNPATMEFGIGLFKASATDGCNNNILLSNTINMQRVNFAAGSAPMPSGATGIIVVNSTPTAATTALTPTSVAGSNSNNRIAGNIIDGGNNGIYLSGYASISPNDDYNNSIGESNTIRNFGGGATAASFATGITANNQWNVLITRNIIDNNTGTGVNTLYTLYGILASGGNNANVNITYNTIKLQSGSSTDILYAINNGAGAGTGTISISDNVITLGYANRSSGNTAGVFNSSVPAVLNMNNNTVDGIVGVPIAGTGDVNGIINSSNIATVNTIGNSIRNIDRTGSGILSGIKITATNWNASDNTIDNLKFSVTSSTGSIYGLSSTSINTNLNSNTIKNLFIPSTGTIYGIYDAGSTGIKTMGNNQIFNFATSTGGTGGSNFYGVYCLNGTVNIGNNSIYSLNISGNNGTASSSVTGIRLDSPDNTISNNKIYDLSANSVNGTIVAIFAGISTSTSTLYNNVVSDLRAPNTNSGIGVIGFRANGSLNLYNNTILLNETIKNGSNAGSTALLFNSSTGNLISRNNIFINKSVLTGTGKAAALYILNYATRYDVSSNNNLLNASTIFTDGTNTDITLAAFKTRMATRDQASVTETTTPFTSTVGSNVDFLRLADGAVSVANNAGLPITTPAITTDYFGVTRDATTPDIGASEFLGTLGNESFNFSSNLTVYPNPSSDVFSINSDARGEIVVYDLIGKTIKTENIDLGITKLDLSNYPSGIYLMKMTNESNESKTIKLIKN